MTRPSEVLVQVADLDALLDEDPATYNAARNRLLAATRPATEPEWELTDDPAGQVQVDVADLDALGPMVVPEGTHIEDAAAINRLYDARTAPFLRREQLVSYNAAQARAAAARPAPEWGTTHVMRVKYMRSHPVDFGDPDSDEDFDTEDHAAAHTYLGALHREGLL